MNTISSKFYNYPHVFINIMYEEIMLNIFYHHHHRYILYDTLCRLLELKNK